MLGKRLMTYIGIALAPVTVVLLDTVLVGPGSGNALVEAVRSSAATPVIAWIFALFMGHWFHPVDGLKPLLPLPWNYVVFGSCTLVVALLNLTVIDTAAASDWLPMVMVLAGFGVGAILWPV